jgi:hypothetical protein
MKNMKTIITLLTAALASSVLSGCVIFSPGSKTFESLSDKEIYAEVRGTLSMGYACRFSQNVNAPYCKEQSEYVWVRFRVGQRNLTYSGGGAIPKSFAPKNGDIVVFRAGDDTQPWGTFERIAARSADTEKLHCGWTGSRWYWGGVECEGWSYKKDYPPLAD